MDCLNTKKQEWGVHRNGILMLGAVLAVGFIGVTSSFAQDTKKGGEADTDTAKVVEQPAVETPAPNMPDAGGLFAKHVKAIGGEKAIRKHASAISKATFSMPAMGMSAEMTITTAAPAKMLLNMTVPGMGEMQQGFDGTRAWSNDPMSGARIMDGDQMKQVAMQSDFYADLNYDKHYKKMTTMEKTVFADRPSYRVHAVTEFGQEMDLFFDEETGLLNGMESTSDSQMGPMTTTTTMTDYKDFGGIKKAATTTISAFGQEQVLTLNSVTYDTVDMSVFDLPVEIKTLLSQASEDEKAESDKDNDEGGEQAEGDHDDDEGGEHAEHDDDDDDDDDDGGGH